LREITVNSDFFFLNQTQSRNSELKKMETKCFVCSSNEIQKSCSASVDLESSFMLFQILEIPQRMSLIRELIKSQIMKYCSDCLGRILKITDMLNELKKLEKEVLREKRQIESQFRENCSKYEQNQDKFIDDIVGDLRTRALQSMFTKISNTTVGLTFGTSTSTRSTTSPDLTPISSKVRDKSSKEQTDPTPISINTNAETQMARRRIDDQDDNKLISESNVNDDLLRSHCLYTDVCELKFDTLAEDNDNGQIVQASDFYPMKEEEVEIPLNYLKEETSVEIVDMDCDMSTNISPEPSKQFICGTCGVNFDDYELLTAHDATHENLMGRNHMNGSNKDTPSGNTKRRWLSIKPKKCDECNKLLPSYAAWRHHVQIAHPAKPQEEDEGEPSSPEEKIEKEKTEFQNQNHNFIFQTRPSTSTSTRTPFLGIISQTQHDEKVSKGRCFYCTGPSRSRKQSRSRCTNCRQFHCLDHSLRISCCSTCKPVFIQVGGTGTVPSGNIEHIFQPQSDV